MTERLHINDLSIADAQYEGFGGAITSSEARPNIVPTQENKTASLNRTKQEGSMPTNHAMYDQFDIIASERMAAGE